MVGKKLTVEATDGLRHQVEHALDALKQAVPLSIESRFPAPRGHANAKLSLRLGGQWHAFTYQVRPVIKSMSQVVLLSAQASDANTHSLLVTSHLGGGLAEQCARQGIQFIDSAGNAYLDVPGQTIFITGRRPANGIVRAARNVSGGTAASGSSALKIIYLLLCVPQAVHWTYREIASAARVSLGSVGTVLQDLDARGLISIGRGVSKPRLLDVPGLVNEWVVNYPLKLRPKLSGRRFTSEKPFSPKEVELPEGMAWWGGGAAAAMWGADVINPKEHIIYVRPEMKDGFLRDLVKRFRLRPAIDGEIEILDAFWNLPDEIQKGAAVPQMLAVSDLLLSRDPRDREAAHWLQQEFG